MRMIATCLTNQREQTLLKSKKNLSIILQGQSWVRRCGVPQYMMQLHTSKVRRCRGGVSKKGMSCKCMPTCQGERTNLQYMTRHHRHERSNNQKRLYIPYHDFVMSQDVRWVSAVEGKRWRRRCGSGRVRRRHWTFNCESVTNPQLMRSHLAFSCSTHPSSGRSGLIHSVHAIPSSNMCTICN